MKTIHRWFSSDHDSLLGHFDLPDQCGDTGIVVVPPFGWEEVCSYRPLRSLAQALAENGIAVLRYDLPGTGDSSGGPGDSDLIQSWIRSVAAAVRELRSVVRVERVALFGIGFGAMLAAAASRASRIQDLILWGALASGRAALRELRAYANMERWEYTTADATPPPQPVAGFEVGGFLITPETQRAMEALDLASMPDLRPRRVLIFSRDEIPADQKLVRALRSSGCDVRLERGPGFSGIMAIPNESTPPPPAIMRAIVDFVGGKTRNEALSAGDAAVTRFREPPVEESVYRVDSPRGTMFGILTSALDTPRDECCALFLNAGGVRHTGPNRMWVDAARRQAAKGVASLRLDLPGIGESCGDHSLDIPSLYQEQLVDEVELAMDSLRSRLGIQRFVAIGLCSGAFWAFHAALRNADVCGAVLMNPRLFFWDPEVDRRRLVRRNATRITNRSEWRRLIHGEMRIERIKRAARLLLRHSQATWSGAFSSAQIPAKRMAEAWTRVERNGSRMTFIFTEGEPLLCEMEDEHQMPPQDNPRVRLIRIPNAGHTFRPQWSQKLALDLIDREIESAAMEHADEVLKVRR